MACPTKRHGSDNWYFRRQIPADVRAILEKLPKAQRPRNWYRTHISISLKTANRAEAKGRCPEIAAEVEKQIAGLRAGPKALTTKQISALAGELYRGFASGLEENPVLSSKQWREIAEVNEAARQGAFAPPLFDLGIGRTKADKVRVSLEKRFGPMVDAFLRGRGIFTIENSRQKLIERFSVEASEAAKKLARNADGDYSPDEYVKRFPKFEEPRKLGGPSQSLTKLLEAWHEAALNRMKKRDADRMKGRTEKFIAFLGHDDVDRATAEDVIRWAEHRRKEASVVTVNNSDLASIKNVFNWAVKTKKIATSPAAGVSAEGKKKPVVREKYFIQSEIAAILNAASNVRGSVKENPKTTGAKRWVPWLCAYSGARIAEMVQVRKQDPNVQPNHAWRYTFKTLGVEAGIVPLVLDAICGHAPKTQGDAYSKVTLKTRANAMAQFPRYTIDRTPTGGNAE